MTFDGYAFWLFLGVVLVANSLVPARFRNLLLLLASYALYWSFDARFLALIAAVTIADFFIAQRIATETRTAHRRLLLFLSCTVSLGTLGVFKYLGFFLDEASRFLAVIGLRPPPLALELALPIGISFITFTTLGYVLDVYRGRQQPTTRFVDHALFIAFFPKLVAGPIERAGAFLPQIAGPRRVSRTDLGTGLAFILWGLCWKLVVADTMAPIVNGVFGKDPLTLTGPECWVGTYAFALQIYGDFWGYSAIALGVSRWLGFRLVVNFRTPYFARNPSEFWSRWHVSLSTWLRDHVFLPLNYGILRRLGERRWLGLAEEYWSYFAAALATMLAAGLWHGAGWTFVLWGGYLGLLLCLHRAYLGWRKRLGSRRRARGAWATAGRSLLLFHAVCIGWVFFRADSAGQALTMLTRMFSDLSATPLCAYGLSTMALLGGPLLVLEYLAFRGGDEAALAKAHWAVRGLVYSYCVIMIAVFSPVSFHEFIYFRF